MTRLTSRPHQKSITVYWCIYMSIPKFSIYDSSRKFPVKYYRSQSIGSHMPNLKPLALRTTVFLRGASFCGFVIDISYNVCYWRTSGPKKVCKICGRWGRRLNPLHILQTYFGSEVHVRQYNRPYNEFITPTTFISPIIDIFNGSQLSIFDVGYTSCSLDS